LYYIQADGTIFDIQLCSTPENGDSFHYRVNSVSVTPHKLLSPVILSPAELMWAQKILRKYPKTNKTTTACELARDGDLDAIILVYFITAAKSHYKCSSMYKKGFAEILVTSLLTVKVPKAMTAS
jgi:hypothetical protein